MSKEEDNKEENEVEEYTAGEHVLFIEPVNDESLNVTIPFDSINMEKLKEVSESNKDNLKKIKDMSTNDDSNKVSVNFEIKYDQYDIYLNDFITSIYGREDLCKLNKINKILSKKDNKDNKENKCTCHINSNGGEIDEGLILMHSINSSFKHENITTVIDNKGLSMGAVFFTIGSKRIMNEYGYVMLHDYSSGNYNNGGNMKELIVHQEDRLNKVFHDIFVKSNYITEDEFEQFKNGKEFWFGIDQCIERGLCTHVKTLSGDVIKAQEYKNK